MSLVKQALISEFTDLAKKAIEFKKQIDNAKTYPKREMFKKKLTKNNIKAAEILAHIETLINKEHGEKADGANDEVFNDEGRTEAPSGVSTSLE